jgi:hypothetical protein
MKPKTSRFALLFFVLILALPAFFYLTAGGQERILEKVTITNIEIPVRVMYKGKSVIDLKKEDFVIYENGKKMEINGFFLKKKIIKIVESKDGLEKTLPSRTFILAFSITDFNEAIEKAVEHLFDSVFRDNDRLLFFVNDKSLEYLNIGDRNKIKLEVIANLKEQSLKARERMLKYISDVETALNVHNFLIQLRQRFDDRPERAVDFMKKYLLAWNDYKTKYLTPRIDYFYSFARYLEKIKSEKWVFNFYQFDLFPNIRLGSTTMNALRDLAEELTMSNSPENYSTGRLLNTIVNQTLKDLNVSDGAPTEDIAKLFYKVDATFHSFFIKGVKTSVKDDLEYQEVASDIEKTLKEITRITGGETITSNNLIQSIDKVSETEDAYYILTYAPVESKTAGKLKITVNDKKYKVLYDNNFREDYISDYLGKMDKKTQTPAIKIDGFSFDNKILTFTVKEYAIGELDKVKVGRMKIRIRLTDNTGNSLFNQEKILTAQKTEMKISLNTFKDIKIGEYFFLIDVVDMLTNKEANVSHAFTVE